MEIPRSSDSSRSVSDLECSTEFPLKSQTNQHSIIDRKVAIIGRGTFGRALGNRIRSAGAAEVVYGTRNGGKPDEDGHSMQDAVSFADFIILAVPSSAHSVVLDEVVPVLKNPANAGKILLDVSNHAPCTWWKSKRETTVSSNAEQLLRMMKERGLPQPVVKSFNTISAYVLNEGGARSPQTVHICGNNLLAKRRVSELIRAIGMTPTDIGDIAASKHQEELPHMFFQGWKKATVIGTVVFIFWALYSGLRNYTIKVTKGSGPMEPLLDSERIPLGVTIASTGEAGMTLFSIVFLAGTIAGAVQLKRGTASKPFNSFLSSWMSLRKPLGLLAFFLILIHGIAGCIAPSHLKNDKPTPLGQLYLLFGVISFCLFLVLAVSSNQSISSNLSWVEFKFIFSWLGFGGLVFGLAHMLTFGGLIQFLHPSTPDMWPGKMISPYWLGAIIPSAAILGKAMMSIPCVRSPLRRIRGLSKD